MQRYTVNFKAPEVATQRLLVPFLSSSTVKSFASELQQRLRRLGVTVDADTVVFRLDDANGPQIDVDDSLEDVILNPRTEQLFASVPAGVSRSSATRVSQDQSSTTNDLDLLGIAEPTCGGFQIRVITPALAQQEDVTQIAPVPHRLPTTITVKQIRQIVLQQLRLPAEDTTLSDKAAYCNCSLARAIHAGTYLEKGDWVNCGAGSDEQPFLFVHFAGEMSKLSTSSRDHATLRTQALAFAQDQFGNDVEHDMCLNVVSSVGGVALPIVTLCSKSRHEGTATLTRTSQQTTMRLDTHTAEAPISTPLSALTMAEIGLEDVLIDGVLNIYALTRKEAPSISQGTSLGMAAIFETASHWQPEIDEQQSERGMALFLSTLRVVSNILGHSRAEPQMQDAFLGLLHQVTNWPPAVRAMHTLLRGETPTAAECATISQTLFQALDKYVPLRVINFDKSRLFEASRLFFGLLLEKAKHICRANPDDASQPYLTSMKPVNLANSETTEPLIFPVDTNVGLLERGHLAAIKGGLIKFADPSLAGLPIELALDGRTRRAILLSGGLKSSIAVFDMDILYSSGNIWRPNPENPVITNAEVDFSHLSVLCSRNGLAVVAPARLANSDSPVLTLDGEGLGSVYLGRVPCGQPGRDFMLYRPTREGDTTIDPAIVTQLLAPVLAARQADGSAVFDAPGDVTQRRIETPDEILMVCVDCSASMSSSAGFTDMVEEDPRPKQQQSLLEKHKLTDELTTLACPLDEVKEWLGAHESFDDVIRTVHQVCPQEQAAVAKCLLNIMSELAGKELKQQSSTVSGTGRFTSAYHHNPAQDTARLRIESLKKFIIGLHQHQPALIDWVVFRSRMLSNDHEDWTWELGDSMPGFSAAPVVYASDTLDLSIPDEFLCAITYELMQNPVATADSHVYDRPAIEQWLQINNTSPKTGLELINTRLTAQRRILRDINDWVAGSSYCVSTTLGQASMKINFSSRLGTFERSIQSSLSCADLYHIVFQALRGRHSTFELRVQGRLAQIAPGDEAASSKGVRNGCTINISLPETNAISHTGPGTGVGNPSDKCLIKVYNSKTHCLFSYWVPKTSGLSMASVLFKYWRKVVLPWGIAGSMSSLRTWTGMSDSGDGHSRGWIRKPHERINTYLNALHAKGCFETEDVFDKPSMQYNGVLKVYVSSRPPKGMKLRTSRMDVLKQMFDQFVNRTIAYGYNNHLGLITFSSTATIARQLTDVVEDFRATVNQLTPNSDTALWDGLALARHQIEQYSTKFPQAKKRILCISDGEDTKSSRDVIDVCDDLVQSGIVVDSFSLGNEDHDNLLTVSHLTGGYKFVPKTLSQAMQIVELEPVLSLKDRDDVIPPPAPRGSTRYSRFNLAMALVVPEIMTEDVFPKRRAHPNINDDVIELAAAKRMVSSNRTESNMLRNSRLLTEIQNIIANPHPHYDVFVSERDISFWKIVMTGPPESPYASGTFLLYLHMDEQSKWPTFAPSGRFCTSIHHPNVNSNGRICHSIFDRNWTSDTSCSSILNSIYGLLLVPDYSDPVNVVSTLDYHHDQVEFADITRAHIAKHASKSRAEWRRELLGDP